MSILITGGAGFIGSHLIERLLKESQERLVCLDSFNDYYDPALKRSNVTGFSKHERVTIIEESFCNLSAMRRLFTEHEVRLVVHLGAYAGVRPSVVQPLLYVEHNVRGTLVLLEAAREFAVERFLLVSSSTVYGRGASAPFCEDQPLGVPMSPYGASKRAAELLGLTYFDLHRVPVVCLRLFSVYGPRLRPDLAMMVFTEAIASGLPLPLFGDGSIRRDFTYVDDINTGLIAALTANRVGGEAINLGHSEPVEIRHLIALIEDELGRKAIIDHRPSVPEDMPVTFADPTKARRLLEFAPQVPLAEGVRRFVAWYRQKDAQTHPHNRESDTP